MADWIYVGTEGGVDAHDTQSLLRSHGAIWCPGTDRPLAGERLWLLWRDQAGGDVLLLGGGRLVASDAGIFWTSRHDVTMRDTARALGYAGPDSMRFLRLEHRVYPPDGTFPVVTGLGAIPAELSEANPGQVAILHGLRAIT